MEFYPLQALLLFVFYLILNFLGLGLKYYVLFLTPFYATAIIGIGGGEISTSILGIHIACCVFIAWFFVANKQIRKGELVRYSLFLLPFFISLLYNYFFFEPVRGWEIQGENRVNGQLMRLKTSLSSTNITQLIYIIFGVTLACLFSSIRLDYAKTKKTIDITLWTVTIIGGIQFISWYTNFHEIFKVLFNPIQLPMSDQVFVSGWKRINACFQEPSYLGHFLFFSHSFYLLAFGYKQFIGSNSVRASVLIGLLSTATTYYVGFLILAAFMYFRYASKEQKMWYYVIAIFFIPITLYFSVDSLLAYLDAKQSSSDNRFQMGWTLAWEGISKSPFFGIAYGTHRPLFIYTQFLSAIGIFGSLVAIYALLQGKTNANMRYYLLLVFLIGLAAFELTRHEMWIYLGLLSNPYLAQGPNLSNYQR